MKNVKLIVLTVSAVLFLGVGSLNAQEKSTVMITTITTGREITLQVIDDQNKLTTEKFKFSIENPEQFILKVEMDKWLKMDYNIAQTYGYSSTTGVSSNISTRYETIILSKED